MASEKFYLRPDVSAQPLVNHWYAWLHLIPPVQAALNITARHLKIMDSFVSAPQVHAASVRNPAMLGGPFIDLEVGRVERVRELSARMRSERSALIELAYAVKALDDLLRAEAKGHSLEPLYPKVPEPLRGYVELVYDLNNQPSFRLIEALLYESPYYDPSSQSVMLSHQGGDGRPFILSTPVLEGEGRLHARVPFRHGGLDKLFGMRSIPQEFDSAREALGVGGEDVELLRSLLTTEPPPPREGREGGVSWRYFGHACVLVEAPGLSVLTDPVLSYGYESDVPRYSFSDLPDAIDCILLTHGHQDHLMLETLLQLRHKTRMIVVPRSASGTLQDPSLKLMLRKIGFDNVVEVEELDELDLGGGTLTCLPFWGEHADLNVRSKLGYLLRVPGWSALFAADSRNVEPRLYEHVHRLVGDIDALFVGMECEGAPMTWLYGPLLTAPLSRSMDQSRRLSGSDFRQAIELVKCFKFREVYVYAMGQEPWLTYISSKQYTATSVPIIEAEKLVEACRANDIYAERLYGRKHVRPTPNGSK